MPCHLAQPDALRIPGQHQPAAAAPLRGDKAAPGEVLRDQLRTVSNPPGEMIDGGSQERVTAMLKALKDGKAINYNGVGGPVDFDEFGDVITPVNIWQYQGNELKTIKMVKATDIPES